MAVSATPDTGVDLPYCSIQRALSIVGERWTFLILREAIIERKTKFDEIQKLVGVAPNILSDRLNTLVESGILEKRSYREQGSRTRYSYHPTPEGEELRVVLAALQQWGDDHVPPSVGPTQKRVTARGRKPVRVGFIDEKNRGLALDDVEWENTDSYPYELRAERLSAK